MIIQCKSGSLYTNFETECTPKLTFHQYRRLNNDHTGTTGSLFSYSLVQCSNLSVTRASAISTNATINSETISHFYSTGSVDVPFVSAII
jgi:hypothetical protein